MKIYLLTVGIIFKDNSISYETCTSYDILQTLALYKAYPDRFEDKLKDVFVHFCIEIPE
mgnify:CR=1 FL=1